MKRIMIIGSGGAGKTTFARQLGVLVNLPVYHLDKLFWKPGWQETPHDEWVPIQTELVGQDRWIIDGSYARTMPIRIKAADTIIFLDYSRRLCIFRWLKRVCKNFGTTRPDLGENCPEKLDPEMLIWLWRFPKRDRKQIYTMLEQYRSSKQIVILNNPRASLRFLRQLHPHG